MSYEVEPAGIPSLKHIERRYDGMQVAIISRNEEIILEPKGLYPRRNHDRGRDHRLAGGNCGPRFPPGSQTLTSNAYSELSSHDRLRG